MSGTFGFRVWGARGSLPRQDETQRVYGGNTVCVEVLHPGEQTVILDAGTGIANLGDRLLKDGKPAPAHLFLSHYHWDHIMGLPFFGPIYRDGFAISLYGLQSDRGCLEEMLDVTFSAFYSPIYSSENLRSHISIPKKRSSQYIDDLVVKTFDLTRIHPGGCMIMRVEGFGKSFVYAPDVELRDPSVTAEFVRCCQGADVLVCNGAYSQERFDASVGWGHSSLEVAYEAAHRAAVKRLVGIHFEPRRSDREIDETVARQKGRFEGTTLEAAREGDTIWL